MAIRKSKLERNRRRAMKLEDPENRQLPAGIIEADVETDHTVQHQHDNTMDLVDPPVSTVHTKVGSLSCVSANGNGSPAGEQIPGDVGRACSACNPLT